MAYFAGMSLKPILIHPDPRLKKVAEPVARITPEVETLAADMLATMYDAPGIGLAGPQIGVNSRIFVMDAHPRPRGRACAPGADKPRDHLVLG